MVRTRQYRGVFWAIGLVIGIGAIGLVWWLQPNEDRVFVVDATWSHLMRAAREGDPVAVRELLEAGCDPNARGGSQGLTPLIVSAANGHREVVELLLSHGASLEVADNSGMTPLMNAVLFDQPAVAQVLLDHGANVNASTVSTSMTPLMFATTPTTAKLLLQNGADASLRSREDKTAVDYAQRLGRTELAAVIRMAESPSAIPNTTVAPNPNVVPNTPILNTTVPNTPVPNSNIATREPVAEPPLSSATHSVVQPGPEREPPVDVAAFPTVPEPQLVGGEVPRVVYQNPAAGFCVVVPEDWEMATGNAGNMEIAIDAATGASLQSQPAVWFFYASHAPQQQAELLAQDLRRCNAATTEVRAIGSGRWEVQATFQVTHLGSIWTTWHCCQERDTSFVIAAAVREDLLTRFRPDIETALTSCRLIPHPIVQVFWEPNERAYCLSLPLGWQWEGRILRTSAIPGYFEWKAQRADELVGCFTAEPAVFNIATPYFSPGEAASGIVLERLRTIMADVQLVSVHELPRVEQCLREVSESLLPGSRPQGGKVVADYIATRNGTPIRLRLDIATWMPNPSTVPGIEQRGNWFLFASGVWAPVDEFDDAHWLARSVQTSLLTSLEWKRQQGRAVEDVLSNRRGVLDEASEGWDALIRGMERVPDPDGGPIQEVPNLDGQVWKDLDGRMWRVSADPDTEAWVRDHGWKFIR
jgi:hypothetical protein